MNTPIPSELKRLTDSAEKKGCTVISAVLLPGSLMPYAATIVVEKDGKRIINSGQGYITDGHFAFEIRFIGAEDSAKKAE